MYVTFSRKPAGTAYLDYYWFVGNGKYLVMVEIALHSGDYVSLWDSPGSTASIVCMFGHHTKKE